MNNFNKELISRVKLFYTEESAEEITEEKYAFLKYIFNNLESLDADCIEICEEEFDAINCNIDGCYFDEDNSTYNLYIAIYGDANEDDTTLSKNILFDEYAKIANFIEKTVKRNYSCFSEESISYEIADKIYKNLKNCEIVVNIISNYVIPDEWQKNDTEDVGTYRVSYRTYDLVDLENKFGQINRENFETNFVELFLEPIEALLVTSTADFDVYMCSMKGIWLAKLYKEDSIRLLEQNVRSYLKRTAKVNAGILDTVKYSPEEFITYNNGISAVATGIEIGKDCNVQAHLVKINSIYNFQIVNGGQTTATLYECFKDKLTEKLSKVLVPVKLTVVKNIGNSDDLIRNISLYSNTQTQIKKSDPPSNMPFYVDIKKLSQACVSSNQNINYICYFERTNGEYNTEYRRNNCTKRFSNTNPKDKKFTKTDLAIAITCWEQYPHKVCEGREKCFAFFNTHVKNMISSPDENYFKTAYACITMYRKLDKLAKKMGLTYKSNVIAYTLSLISYLFSKKIDLYAIWEKKDLTDDVLEVAKNLLPKVHSIIANAPKEHPEPRMWARKEQCWELIKVNVRTAYSPKLLQTEIEFFPSNEALVYIEDDNNFFNSVVWMKLLIWDSKYKMLNSKQKNIVKYIRTLGDKDSGALTRKQKDYLKDIFMFAVKRGFQYK